MNVEVAKVVIFLHDADDIDISFLERDSETLQTCTLLSCYL